MCFSKVFARSGFRSWHWFLIRSWCQHASIFLPKIHQKCIKTGTWKPSIFWCVFAWIPYRFSFDLGGQLGATLAPKTRPRRLQDGSQDEVRDFFRSSGDFDRLLVDFWSMFDCFSIDFWFIFDRFSIDLGLIFDRFPVGVWSCFNHFLHRFLIDSNTQSSPYFLLKRGGGYAALLRFG